MPKFKVITHIFIKPAVLNPEELPTADALRKLGFDSVAKIQMGKCHIVHLDAPDANSAKRLMGEMCRKLLINPVTEEFTVADCVPAT